MREPKSLSDLESLVTARFEVEPETARRDITALLKDLSDRKLIEVVE
jgi:hypothetical protein